MDGYFGCLYVCAPHAFVVPKEARIECQSHGIGITDGCERLGIKQRPLKEPFLLRVETSLQPLRSQSNLAYIIAGHAFNSL